MKHRTLFGKLFVLVLTGFLPSIFVQPTPAQTNPRPPQEEKLLNGLKILMWPDAAAKNVAVRIRIHSGAAFDPQGREGVMKMLAENIFPNASARDFFSEDLGGSLEIVTTYDYIQINASSKPESFLTMMETLASAISNPTIDKENTTKVRDALLAKLKNLEADPTYIADRAVAKRLFGTFPYGRPEMGTSETVRKIDFADLLDAKNRFLTADNATLTMSGNFDKSLAFRAVRRYFGGWIKSDKKVPSTFRQPDDPDTKQLKIELPNLQNSYFRLAVVAPSRRDKDYYSMQVLRRILQARFNYYENKDDGQLSCGRNYYQANLLRGVYGVAVSRPMRKDGELPINGRNVCSFILKDADGGYNYGGGISQVDFDKGKAKILSEFNESIQTASGLADLWLDLDTYKLSSFDDESRKLNAVTISDVSQLAETVRKAPTVTVSISGAATN